MSETTSPEREHPMKLLGLSCGRKNGNGEILLKEALLAVKEAGGIDVEIVRLLDLDINPCTGCEGCTQSMTKGGTGECVQWKNDDALWLRDRFDACDGLIASAPCFVLRPSGRFCTMNDRFLGFGPKFLMGVFHRKKRIAAAIASGGSDWTQLMMAQMMPALFMLNMKVVDQFQANWVASAGHVLLRDDLIERARKLGVNVASAMKKPVEEAAFMGDRPGTCPYCHTDLVTLQKKRVVECPICGIKGELSIKGDEISVAWNEEDIKHIRWEPLGMKSHFNDIMETHGKFAKGREMASARIGKYTAFAPFAKPKANA
jgi:multimeric flavodoxin WrbA